MRRRNFLQKLGIGTSGVLAAAKLNATPFNKPASHEVSSVYDLYNREGEILLRFNFFSDGLKQQVEHAGKFNVKNGRISRVKAYYFSSPSDDLDPGIPGMDILSSATSEDVIVLWLEEASGETQISFPTGRSTSKVTIDEIIASGDVEVADGQARVSVSFLLDDEIGEIDPKKLGIRETGSDFSIAVMADPQGGNPFAHEKVHTRMRIHNAFIDESVKLVNNLDPAPAFNIVIGDIVDGQGHHADFRAMNDMLENVNVPTLYELGNHETKYKSVFGPGYNMKAFDNYFGAQKEFNGMNKLLYSFNVGAWHFIVWPDPLRNRFWQTHPHYFDWLERDLQKYRQRPTVFFQHIPLHPIGILPLINYAETVEVKRTLLDILAQHGNVKYVLSGHVHIPMKASVKTSVEYKGMKMINLPAAGYRPRAFGEEDYNGGPSQGIAVINIRGLEASVEFQSVTTERFRYPEPKPFNNEKYPLWLNHKWELAHDGPLKNANFSDGLKHWFKRFVYTEDVHPSNICEARKDDNGQDYLYMFSKPRGYSAPGQDRLPQSINRICQVIRTDSDSSPILELDFMLDSKHYAHNSKSGAIIWLEGFEKGLKRLNVVYSNNYVHWHLGGNQSQLRTTLPVHMDITSEPGKWQRLRLNPYSDFASYTEDEKTYIDRVDTFAVNFGVWTINEGIHNTVGACFRRIRLEMVSAADFKGQPSTINGKKIAKKEQKFLWWHGVKHFAGEHKSYVEDLNKYL